MEIIIFVILLTGVNVAEVSGHGFIVRKVTCCSYCRSQAKYWVKLAGTFQLSNNDPFSKLNDPPAYLVDDEQETTYTVDSVREHKLKYAGAPLAITHSYSPNEDPTPLIDTQYFQIDLTSPKYVGGVLTQGGYHEETLLGFYPFTESWVTQYVISYSNTTTGFQLFKGESGNVQIFEGNMNANGIRINSFSFGITTRYIRLHPLKAEGEAGGLQEVNVRVTAVTCSRDVCITTRINCLLTEWSSWSECTCGATGCSYQRTRSIRRVQACGGEKCGSLKDTESCTPTEPAWKAAAQYVGIVLALMVIAAIVGFIIYKKTHKNQVQVIVVTENENNKEPCVVPKGDKAREAAGATGPAFGDMNGKIMEDNFMHAPPGMPDSKPQYPCVLPKPPMFKMGDMHRAPPNPFHEDSPPRYGAPTF